MRILLLRTLAMALPLASCLAQAAPPPGVGPRGDVLARPLQRVQGGRLPDRLGELRLTGAWDLDSPDPEFGGISAALLVNDHRLLLLSDRSHLFDLVWPVHAGAAGAPFTMAMSERRELVDTRRQPLDAEAMTPAADGAALLVSNEGTGRLETFPDHAVHSVRSVPDIAPGADRNQGVEALASLPDGSWLAIGEAVDLGHGHLAAAVRVAGDRRQPLRYRPAEGFHATDADVAGAYLFVLERQLSILNGWRARVVAVPLAALPDRDDAVIEGRELAMISGPTLGENYEGLAAAVRRPPGSNDAAYRLLLVADDNFNAVLQQTLMLELEWQPAASAAPAVAAGEG